MLVLLTGCQENWSDYYSQMQGDGGSDVSDASSENLLGYLKTVPEYSEFVKLLEETKVSEELTRNQVLTIWAPTNAAFPATEIAAMNAEKKRILCQNHINYVALYNTKLTDNKQIKTLAGKNLFIREIAKGTFSIDGKNVTKLDQKCTNGVIHEIEGWLVQRQSIFEYILDLGPEYSLLRDSILALSDTVFKPGQSFPLGVDELGNTIYDSVFVIENSLLVGKADVRSEDDDFTFFLPSNEVFRNMYKDMDDYFTSTGGQITKRDSSMFFSWILRAIIHEGKIGNYTGELQSVYGENYKWRTDKQLVQPGGYKVCSNGYVYDMAKIHIPKFTYLTTVKAYPAYIFDLPEEKQSEYYTVQNATTKAWVVDGRTLFAVDGQKKEPVSIFEFKTLTKDYRGELIDGVVAPGFYKVSASYRTYLCNNVKLSINDEEVATYNASNAKFSYKAGIITEEFEIKEEWGTKMLRIKQEDVGKAGRLYMEYIIFEPTSDNY